MSPKRVYLRVEEPVTQEEIGYPGNGIKEIADVGKFVVIIERTIQLC